MCYEGHALQVFTLLARKHYEQTAWNRKFEGDSGGPVLRVDGTIYYQVGVIAAIGTDRQNQNLGFQNFIVSIKTSGRGTAILPHYNWIEKIVGKELLASAETDGCRPNFS